MPAVWFCITLVNGCKPCSDGYVKANQSLSYCVPCIGGTVADSNRITCNQCDAGFQPNANNSLCLPCPSNTFKSISSLDFCNSCPLNAVCNITNFQCNPGYTITTSGINAYSGCQQCAYGSYKNVTGNLLCTSCPNGTVSDPQNLYCKQCDAGFEPNSNKSLCIPCSSGYYKPFSNLNNCLACPQGSFCDTQSFTCNEGHEIRLFNSSMSIAENSNKNSKILIHFSIIFWDRKLYILSIWLYKTLPRKLFMLRLSCRIYF